MAKNQTQTDRQYRDFQVVAGMRPVASQFPPNWLVGKPFRLDAAIANGAATAVNLDCHDAWYRDGQARQAYGLSDGSTTKVQATLHLEAVALEIVDSDFTVLVSSTKDNLFTCGPFIKATIGGTVYKFGLEGAIRDRLEGAWAAATSSPATTVGANIRGRKLVIPLGMDIDLFNDSLVFGTEADAALGAAIDAHVLLYGTLVPLSEGIPSSAPGRYCGQPMAFNEAAYRSETIRIENSND